MRSSFISFLIIRMLIILILIDYSAGSKFVKKK